MQYIFISVLFYFTVDLNFLLHTQINITELTGQTEPHVWVQLQSTYMAGEKTKSMTFNRWVYKFNAELKSR